MLALLSRKFASPAKYDMNVIRRLLEFSDSEDRAKGIKDLVAAEKDGSFEARCLLSIGHRDGRYGLPKNADKAHNYRAYLKLAADEGDAEAQFFYAICVQATNPEQCDLYLRHSAQQKFGRAIAERGLRMFLFEKELGRARVLEVLREGVELGCPYCENALGTVLLLTHKDQWELQEAAFLLRKAAEKGNTPAQRTLKMAIESGVIQGE